MFKAILFTAALLPLGGCGTMAVGAMQDDPLDIMSGGRKSGAALERSITEASKHPLGSQKNPIRVNMPPGQRAYLSRLRCSDGKAPTFGRVGNFGAGVFGSIIDGYRVVCETGEPRESMIYMDMYHPTHKETGAPPGFTLMPEGPVNMAKPGERSDFSI